MQIKTVLTVAGSDSSGGAGIQADIKTMTMNGVYAMSVITALTAQNTVGVRAIQESTPEFLKQQLDTVFFDKNKCNTNTDKRIIAACNISDPKYSRSSNFVGLPHSKRNRHGKSGETYRRYIRLCGFA